MPYSGDTATAPIKSDRIFTFILHSHRLFVTTAHKGDKLSAMNGTLCAVCGAACLLVLSAPAQCARAQMPPDVMKVCAI
jgi:hypothetical protein